MIAKCDVAKSNKLKKSGAAELSNFPTITFRNEIHLVDAEQRLHLAGRALGLQVLKALGGSQLVLYCDARPMLCRITPQGAQGRKCVYGRRNFIRRPLEDVPAAHWCRSTLIRSDRSVGQRLQHPRSTATSPARRSHDTNGDEPTPDAHTTTQYTCYRSTTTLPLPCDPTRAAVGGCRQTRTRCC